MPSIRNIGFDLGEDWLLQVFCFNASGAALDLTGGSAVMCVGLFSDPVVPEIVGEVVAPPTNGIVNFRLPGADQDGVSPGIYPYTIRVTLSDGTINDQVAGNLTVRNC